MSPIGRSGHSETRGPRRRYYQTFPTQTHKSKNCIYINLGESAIPPFPKSILICHVQRIMCSCLSMLIINRAKQNKGAQTHSSSVLEGPSVLMDIVKGPPDLYIDTLCTDHLLTRPPPGVSSPRLHVNFLESCDSSIALSAEFVQPWSSAFGKRAVS